MRSRAARYPPTLKAAVSEKISHIAPVIVIVAALGPE
jgi:hypothetical protein